MTYLLSIIINGRELVHGSAHGCVLSDSQHCAGAYHELRLVLIATRDRDEHRCLVSQSWLSPVFCHNHQFVRVLLGIDAISMQHSCALDGARRGVYLERV